jgi:hypothetical protein
VSQPASARAAASGACEAAVKGMAGASAARLCEGGHLVIAFRGTASGAEWERGERRARGADSSRDDVG